MNKSLCRKCSGNKSENKWLPRSINSLVIVLSKKISDKSLSRNIAYNLQYLEYIDESLKQLHTTSVIQTQSYKIFVVISLGIIEAILFYEIKKSGNEKKNTWNLIKKIKSNEAVMFEDKIFRMETHVYERLSKGKNEELKFQQILNIIENKNLLNCDKSIFENIRIIKKLRNKLHLQSIEHKNDTDWNNFNYEQYILAKTVLLQILNIYLNLSDTEIKKQFGYLMSANN